MYDSKCCLDQSFQTRKAQTLSFSEFDTSQSCRRFNLGLRATARLRPARIVAQVLLISQDILLDVGFNRLIFSSNLRNVSAPMALGRAAVSSRSAHFSNPTAIVNSSSVTSPFSSELDRIARQISQHLTKAMGISDTPSLVPVVRARIWRKTQGFRSTGHHWMLFFHGSLVASKLISQFASLLTKNHDEDRDAATTG